MTPEKEIFNQEENLEEKKESVIDIKRSTDAPPEVKENPFYDPEFWGRANRTSEDVYDIYLPDSDEAISFSVAAHEVGHLIEEGKRYDADLDNFEAVRTEEQRAWDKGWEYLQKYLTEYYQDKPEPIPKIQQAFERIKDFFMQATDLSEEMYLEKGALENLSQEERDEILKKKREEFFSEKGEEFKEFFENTIKREEIGVKPNWDKFVVVVKKAIEDVIIDNKNSK